MGSLLFVAVFVSFTLLTIIQIRAASPMVVIPPPKPRAPAERSRWLDILGLISVVVLVSPVTGCTQVQITVPYLMALS